MELSAKYFDGSIREGRDAIVETLSESLKIQPKEAEYISPVYWQLKDITRIRHHKPGMTMLHNTASPKEYLELSTGDFDTHIAAYYRGHAFAGPVVEKTGSIWKPVLIVATFIIGGLALLYFLVVPWVAERFAYVVPKDTEISIGETMFKNTISGYTVNDSATETINKFFQKIKHPQDYTIKITVVKEPQVNAFAMPGGNIVVFDGIIRQMDNYPQLAALLGHEFSHIQHRHTTRSIFRSLGNYLFFAALFGDTDGVAAIIVQNTNALKELHYSRGLEHEADEKGFELMVQNNIDPNGMVQLFDELEAATKGSEIPEFISSHPITDSRREFAKEEIAKGGFTVKEDPEMKALFEKLKEQAR